MITPNSQRTDKTFITNESDNTLLERFRAIFKGGVKEFDCLVGYFYSTGFYKISDALKETDKIRILIGMGTDLNTLDYIRLARTQLSERIIDEMFKSKYSSETYNSVMTFLRWISEKKIEIKVYPKKLHAKLYIMTFKDGCDEGRVITGSSNLTEPGLLTNLEFNVELKNSSDWDYAKKKFEELWVNAIDVTDECSLTISKKTWINDSLTPYEIFLKFLYEYFSEIVESDTENAGSKRPEGFMELEYQMDAVGDAIIKINKHNGVLISDVVGLGKTYIATMVAQRVSKKGTLVVAPPALVDDGNPGSWNNAFHDFGFYGRFISLGELEKIDDASKYDVIVVDEAHRFRNDHTNMYSKLHEICKGKKVILVSATPFNNKPDDIKQLIKLFQDGNNSTIPDPEVRNLDLFFKKINKKIKSVKGGRRNPEYSAVLSECSKEIRNKVLGHFMIRRTRTVIEKYYAADMKKQGLSFPFVHDPIPVYYELLPTVEHAFDKSLELISRNFNYSRYSPLLYLKKPLPKYETTAYKNISGWIKILLVKRLESSFQAFKESIKRFRASYQKFIDTYEKEGKVIFSKKHALKIMDALATGDETLLEKYMDENQADYVDAREFKEEFIEDLHSDLAVLEEIDALWNNVEEDPKILKLIELLDMESALRKSKIIIFTESEETGRYITNCLKAETNLRIFPYSGTSDASARNKVIGNFDPKANNKLDDIDILVTTEVLSEGVNLNKSNVIVNYDIPWNPIRMMQRVGRINRVGKELPFDTIYTYNFFPAGQIDDEIQLRSSAESKIKAFIQMLGNDARLLTEEDVISHDVFSKLNDKKTLNGDTEDSGLEIEYLLKLRDVQKKSPELYQKIKTLPKKAKCGRKYHASGTVSFLRKGGTKKIYLNNKAILELGFQDAISILQCNPEEKSIPVSKNFYEKVDEVRKSFSELFTNEEKSEFRGKQKDIMRFLNAIETDLTSSDDFNYIENIRLLIKNGALPPTKIKELNISMKGLGIILTKDVITEMKKVIPPESAYIRDAKNKEDKSQVEIEEIIISEDLIC